MSTPWLLIVDDDPDIVALIAMVTARLGYHACTAEGLDECLSILSNADSKPQVVILDLHLGDADPHNTCAVVRQYIGPDVLLVAITGDPSVNETSAPGASLLIHKPFDVGALLNRIANMISHSGR
ncbi:MAG: response regulator [Armatimonadota bacterium]